MSGYEAAWFEAAEFLREVYVGDDSDMSIEAKPKATKQEQKETPKAPTLRAFDLATLSADELRVLADTVSPHAAAV